MAKGAEKCTEAPAGVDAPLPAPLALGGQVAHTEMYTKGSSVEGPRRAGEWEGGKAPHVRGLRVRVMRPNHSTLRVEVVQAPQNTR